MATIKVILKKNKLKSNGKYPLYLRIIEGEKNTFKSTGIDVFLDEWDENKQRVKSKHSNSGRINLLLAKKISEVEDLKFQLDGKKGIGDLLKKENELKIAKEISFIKYFQNYIDELKASEIAGTYKRAKSILEKFKNHHNQKDVLFNEFTIDLLKDYEIHLRSLKNSTNTIHANLKMFRMLFNKAVIEDLIDANDNPFIKFRLKKVKVEQTFLTEDEVKAIDNVNVTPGTVIEKHKDLFVFACYAGGIRISDLLQLRWENYDFKNNKVSFFIQKTKENHTVKLPNRAQEIINKYYVNPKIKGYIFGLLPESVYGSTSFDLLNKISSSNAYANKNLKILAKKANIERNISFHSSRHSWATIALKKGVPITHISEILRHADIGTTMGYAKLVNKDLDDAMSLFN
ncbi:site-specific integrase [Aquirufa aurantiipilula]|uniref:site-specific integrase n=1 Tax=Aquirufa aurantiipilula TaxID=2696561 RepID=UPI001CAA57BC|nr:site-specific integrase [Aquirufa aurantiipilula]MBZ1327020.1 site-specific integrase [Aquirufa aurantiipilula]